MADKYVIHGAANNGDGTQPTEATSPGGPGAWNDLAAVLSGTPGAGALNDGDTVYVRALDASNQPIVLSYTTATTIGLTSANNLVAWVVDDGTVWPGVTGTVTLQADGDFTTQVAVNNWFIGRWRYFINLTSRGSSAWIVFQDGAAWIGGEIDGGQITSGYGGTGLTCYNGVIIAGTHIRSHSRYYSLVRESNYKTPFFVGCNFELLNPGEKDAIFYLNGYDWTVVAYGGSIYGPGAAENVYVSDIRGTSFEAIFAGLRWPRLMTHFTDKQRVITATGHDGRFGGLLWITNNRNAEARYDYYYPTVKATDPGGKRWSWGILSKGASLDSPAFLPTYIFNDQPDATKTVTWEILAHEELPVDTSNVWMVVNYYDPSGVLQTESTLRFPGQPLTTSAAEWSSITYGPNKFNPYRLQLTTSQPIAQNTVVTATLYVTASAQNTQQIIVADGVPEVV